MGRNGDYNNAKQELISTYKFTMAFENGNAKDYVTEKLFGVLAAGSVPCKFSFTIDLLINLGQLK
jgi:hypothetical protein